MSEAPPDRVYYFEGSRAESLRDRLLRRFEWTGVRHGDTGGDGMQGPAVFVAATAEEVEGARALWSKDPAIEIVALIDPSTVSHAADVHAYVAGDAPPYVIAKTLASAVSHARLERGCRNARAEAARLARDLHALNAIGVRLSSEHDIDTLLGLILAQAREITRSDAGSLYLVEPDEAGTPRLRFKLTQNDSVAVSLHEFTLALTSESIAGHVALTGQPVRLDDAYAPPAGAPFRINRAFDDEIGYRTKSMLVVPMKTTKGETVGVLQLINRKADLGEPFRSPADIERQALPFSPGSEELAASLASQAAVALENARLYRSIQTLFEGFVRASVVAIEARDPTTSGHSFRVAELTVGLAEVVDRVESGPYAAVRFTPEQMREIRYASLLHDFGKVGVPEHILVKSKKLLPGQLEQIVQRVELLKAGLALRNSRRKLQYLLERGAARFKQQCEEYDAEVASSVELLDTYLNAAVRANEPSLVPEGVTALLQEIVSRTFEDHLGAERTVISPEEARILSIPKGSLTDKERREIESHVQHSFEFLSQIPWTRDLERIPDIARSHHEKLTGAGYPYGMKGDAIPIQSRMMTIADIYDALTAADRPYKNAVSVARALEILGAEARAGNVDPALLALFIEGKVFEGIHREAAPDTAVQR